MTEVNRGDSPSRPAAMDADFQDVGHATATGDHAQPTDAKAASAVVAAAGGELRQTSLWGEPGAHSCIARCSCSERDSWWFSP